MQYKMLRETIHRDGLRVESGTGLQGGARVLYVRLLLYDRGEPSEAMDPVSLFVAPLHDANVEAWLRVRFLARAIARYLNVGGTPEAAQALLGRFNSANIAYPIQPPDGYALETIDPAEDHLTIYRCPDGGQLRVLEDAMYEYIDPDDIMDPARGIEYRGDA